VKVLAADGTTQLYTAVVTGRPVVRPLEAASTLQLLSKPSTYDTYRGTLTLSLGAGSVSVVNTLGLDSYLRGVVPVEMPSTWPAEALRAQAIAARSYAVRRLHPKTGSYDVYDDTRSQVYRGLEAERATTNAVISASPGAILLYGTSVVNAFFSSTGGGATESNEYAFVGSSGSVGTPVKYLRGIVDRSSAGIPWDADAPRYTWSTSTLTRAQLTAMFKADSRTNVGDLLKLDLRRRGVSGRLYAVRLYGSTGTKTVSGDVFRSVYNAKRPSGSLSLQSNLFDTKPIP
jgi:stage II sporulation protein D